MKLHEWIVVYLKHKDAFTKSLQEIKEGDPMTFVYKDGPVSVYVADTFSVPSGKGKTILTVLHTKDNVTALINNWNKVKKNTDLTVIFANPQRNERLSIKPSLHDRVCGDNLEPSIWALAENVSFV